MAAAPRHPQKRRVRRWAGCWDSSRKRRSNRRISRTIRSLFIYLAFCNFPAAASSNEVREEKKMGSKWLVVATLVATAALLPAAPPTLTPLENKVRHELVMMPYLNVFDDI